MRSDEELLDAWRRGDAQAGNQLFSRHFKTVQRFFLNKTSGEVEDLVQQTFEACTSGRDRYEGRAPFKVYLLRIARNLLYRHWEARNKRRAEDIDQLSLADLGAGPSTALARDEAHRRLVDALRQIPLGQQEILELYYWEELSGRQLAQVLGVSENTARSRLRRAKLTLADALHRIEDEARVPWTPDVELEARARAIQEVGVLVESAQGS